jgi:hypothetical protein
MIQAPGLLTLAKLLLFIRSVDNEWMPCQRLFPVQQFLSFFSFIFLAYLVLSIESFFFTKIDSNTQYILGYCHLYTTPCFVSGGTVSNVI